MVTFSSMTFIWDLNSHQYLKKGYIFDVVDKLTKPLQGLNAWVFFDNAYTSIPSLVHLQRKQSICSWYCVWTASFSTTRYKKHLLKNCPGVYHKTYQDTNNPDLTCTVWQDVKQVQFASTIHKPHVTGVPQCHVGHAFVQVTIPQVAQEYGRYYKAINFFLSIS